jgi:glycolate oxidase
MNEKKKTILKRFEEIVGKDWVITESEFIKSYIKDETPKAMCPSPAKDLVLIKPIIAEEISNILKVANEEKIPVYPVGGRTGLVGGSVPIKPGIILSLERMNKINIDEDNLMAIVDAGATLEDLIKTSKEAGLFFPLHPGDEGAQFGGLIATNAGGVRAVKYGVIRNYVKGIEAILPTGEIINLGGKLIKNNLGYDLMQLIIGSEGTLCIITKAVIKIYPKNIFTKTLIIPFTKRLDAIFSVQKILRSSITPLAIEYVDLKEINESAKHLKEEWPIKVGKAQLIIIVSKTNDEELLTECERISGIVKEFNAGEVILAETKEEQERILKIRSNIYTTLKPQIIDILDITVPPSRLGDLMNFVQKLAKKYKVYIPIYGHAGDGNLHVHIMKENDRDLNYVSNVKKEIYKTTTHLGGVLTGEHGIGKIRVNEMNLMLSNKEITLMREIKKIFDPNYILNPGNVLSL